MIVAVPLVAQDSEYVVLPVSTLSNKSCYCKEYDILLEKSSLINSTLDKDSYVRAHKRTVIYKADIDFTKCIVDLKKNHPPIFTEIIDKMSKYDSLIKESAKI